MAAMGTFRVAFLALAVVLAAAPATAARLPPALQAGGSARATEIVDGDTLVLDSGESVRLVGIQAPKLPLGRRGFRKWPLADEAKAALGEIALGRRLALGYGGRRRDRHGRLLAHLFDEDGRWIQGELLRRGLARVYSFPDNRALVAEMLALEREARAAGRGIWTDPFYRVRGPDGLERLLDTFQLVEGRVRAVAVVRGRGYLNFGADWRTDFTVVVPPRHRRLFEAEGIDLKATYEGRRVRVRGWLKSFNGPMIEATHPEQIELLDP